MLVKRCQQSFQDKPRTVYANIQPSDCDARIAASYHMRCSLPLLRMLQRTNVVVHVAAGEARQLYQVLEQKEAAAGQGLMGSDHTYVVPGAGTEPAAQPAVSLRKCESAPLPCCLFILVISHFEPQSSWHLSTAPCIGVVHLFQPDHAPVHNQKLHQVTGMLALSLGLV